MCGQGCSEQAWTVSLCLPINSLCPCPSQLGPMHKGGGKNLPQRELLWASNIQAALTQATLDKSSGSSFSKTWCSRWSGRSPMIHFAAGAAIFLVMRARKCPILLSSLEKASFLALGNFCSTAASKRSSAWEWSLPLQWQDNLISNAAFLAVRNLSGYYKMEELHPKLKCCLGNAYKARETLLVKSISSGFDHPSEQVAASLTSSTMIACSDLVACGYT